MTKEYAPMSPPDLEHYEYQKEGIKFTRDKFASLIADDMGLGKTPQAIGVINENKYTSVLVICPANLKVNWLRELNTWLYDMDITVGIATAKNLPKTDVVIVNYDILSRDDVRVAIRSREWDMIIMDEAHYIKNDTAKRTREIVGWRHITPIRPVDGGKLLLLTGTPITNKPIDLWTICHLCRPDLFHNKWAFLQRYCDPRTVYTKAGRRRIFDGGSNLNELAAKLSTFMIRRFKDDVLDQRPDKMYSVVEFDAPGWGRSLISEENSLAQFAKDSDRIVIEFGDTSTIRKELGLLKVRPSMSRLKDMLEQSDGKIVVFAYHKEVVETITQEFSDIAVMAHGGMSLPKKQKSIDSFQDDPRVRMFVGTIGSAGVGITLTSASTVVFVELDYSPSQMDQAMDRVDRLTQKSPQLNYYFFVYKGSLDANIAYRLVQKKETIEQALGVQSQAY